MLPQTAQKTILKMIHFNALNSFIHTVEKWPYLLLKSCIVHTTRKGARNYARKG